MNMIHTDRSNANWIVLVPPIMAQEVKDSRVLFRASFDPFDTNFFDKPLLLGIQIPALLEGPLHSQPPFEIITIFLLVRKRNVWMTFPLLESM
jgi:hypothetical protein